MIDKKELRIGNWILEAIYAEEGESANLVRFSQHTFSQPNDDYSFIDLAPRILQACRAGKASDEEDLYRIGELAFRYSGHALILLGNDRKPIPGTSPIGHLHHLQNLYFALTGQELLINEQALKEALRQLV